MKTSQIQVFRRKSAKTGLDISSCRATLFDVTAADKARIRRQATWKIETAGSFAEAEAQTRAYWRSATPAERLNALETLREQLYGEDKTSRRLQRVLEVVPAP